MLQSVLDTEITAELVPTGAEEDLQSSEAKVGPFALQDFSLFPVLRYGFLLSKVAFLAWHTWSDPDRGNWPPGFPESKRLSYSLKEIRHWLHVFVQRFYSFSQSARRCLTARGVVRRFVVATWGLACPVGHVGAGLLDDIDRAVPEE